MNQNDELFEKLKLKQEKITASVTDPITNDLIKYNIVNKTTLWRAETLFNKEPITIKWIRSFKKNKTMFDVGANVGIYSIYAALTRMVKVYAFEPESNNFQNLMQNLVINNLNELISPFPIGISNKTELTKLQIGIFEAGSSHHTVGINHLDHNTLEIISNKVSQGIFSTTLDDLCFNWKLPIPSYLKIDVDGIESKIIAEAKKTLSDSNLESVLIEINENREEDIFIINSLKKIGFSYDKNQVEDAKRKSGPHKGYAEYLFYK